MIGRNAKSDRWMTMLGLGLAVALPTMVALAGGKSPQKGKDCPMPHSGGGGNVLPPQAKPFGWSLKDMAAAVASFSLNGNDPSYYPTTPFQILYRQNSLQDPTGANTFTVKPGTWFYVKIFYIDDAPPVWGVFPTNTQEAGAYLFDPDKLGAHDQEVEVDGQITTLDRGYVPGPVDTPNSPDGSAHLIQMGAFLSPLSKGTHHITIRGIFDGDLWDNVAPGFVFQGEVSFTVIVTDDCHDHGHGHDR